MLYTNGQQIKAGDLVVRPSKSHWETCAIGVVVACHNGYVQLVPVLMRSVGEAGDSGWFRPSDQLLSVAANDLTPIEVPKI